MEKDDVLRKIYSKIDEIPGFRIVEGMTYVGQTSDIPLVPYCLVFCHKEQEIICVSLFLDRI